MHHTALDRFCAHIAKHVGCGWTGVKNEKGKVDVKCAKHDVVLLPGSGKQDVKEGPVAAPHKANPQRAFPQVRTLLLEGGYTEFSAQMVEKEYPDLYKQGVPELVVEKDLQAQWPTLARLGLLDFERYPQLKFLENPAHSITQDELQEVRKVLIEVLGAEFGNQVWEKLVEVMDLIWMSRHGITDADTS